MRIPGFTAEASLYKSTGCYIMATSCGEIQAGLVEAAQAPYREYAAVHQLYNTPSLRQKIYQDRRLKAVQSSYCAYRNPLKNRPIQRVLS